MSTEANHHTFSVLALLLRPAQTAPVMTASPSALSTLVIGLCLGTVMVAGAARHVGLGATVQLIDLLFIAALLAPLVGYGGLLLGVRLGLLTPAARAAGVRTGELAQLLAWCLLPPLLVGAAALLPVWGDGLLSVAVATLFGMSLVWMVWLMISAVSARLSVSKASSAVLVSSTIAVLVVIYAVLVVLLMAVVS